MTGTLDTLGGQPGKRISYLDGWRGLAILLVLVAHYSHVETLNFGRLGVELFFVLSGRLMAQLLFEKKVPVGTFLFRRFSRVYPAYLIFVVSMIVIELLTDKLNITILDGVAALTFTYNYYQIWEGRDGVLGHIWSLCVEEHTYLLLTTLAVAYRKFKFDIKAALSLLIAIGITIGLVQTLIGMDYYSVYWRSEVRSASILIGALAYLNRVAICSRITGLHSCFIMTVGLLLNLDFVPDPIKYSAGTAFIALSMISIGGHASAVSKSLSSKPLLFAGALSYSLYLWQQPFTKLSSGIDQKLVGALALLIVTAISYYLIEGPARAWLNGRLDRRLGRSTGDTALVSRQ